MTIDQVADYLQLSRWSIHRYIKAGQLRALKGDGRNGAVRIPVSSLTDFIQRHTVTEE